MPVRKDVEDLSPSRSLWYRVKVAQLRLTIGEVSKEVGFLYLGVGMKGLLYVVFDVNGTQPLFIANEGKGVSLEDDFMRLTRRCTIEELHDNNEEGSFVVFGIVRSIVDEEPWWYSACVCGKSIKPQGGAYYCDFCQHYATNVTPRYRIKIAVEDDNGHGVFVLFDREAAYLLKKSCADLFGEV
ncbi:uncharacterized protein LOC107622057 [Arachis ipaensis]|uniref:uncharacterized protein LOC107622057 n=1 Tax=Arachis ipaensis TaxID=130454 RepID=UPI000A2B3CEF|nr:uncharacterized protein LOC107622057 [Arachis ipaensis]